MRVFGRFGAYVLVDQDEFSKNPRRAVKEALYKRGLELNGPVSFNFKEMIPFELAADGVPERLFGQTVEVTLSSLPMLIIVRAPQLQSLEADLGEVKLKVGDELRTIRVMVTKDGDLRLVGIGSVYHDMLEEEISFSPV